MERGGQGPVRAGLPVPREVVPQDTADVARQEYSGSRQVLLQVSAGLDQGQIITMRSFSAGRRPGPEPA